MAPIWFISMFITLFTTGVYSLQCPRDDSYNNGYWKSDGDRCILKCFHNYEPSGCHVIRRNRKGEWNYALPTCVRLQDSSISGSTAAKVGVAAVAGIGAVVAAPAVLAAAGFGAAGVAVASFAAWIQTPLTAAGGWFAASQSAGVVGLAVGTKVVIGTASSGLAYAFMSDHCERE